MLTRLLIAAAFSLFYIGMYPILTGGFVIYVYPYLPPRAALAWLVAGFVVQAWFCFISRTGPRSGPAMTVRKVTLQAQLGAGVLYAASLLLFSGGCYQSLIGPPPRGGSVEQLHRIIRYRRGSWHSP